MDNYYKIHSYTTSVPPLPLAASSLNAQNAPLSTNSIETASYSSSIEDTFKRATEAQDDLYYRFFGKYPQTIKPPSVFSTSRCPPIWTWPPNYKCFTDIDVPTFTPRPNYWCKDCSWLGYRAGNICVLLPNHPDYVPAKSCYSITGYDKSGRCVQGSPAMGASCCMCMDIMYYGYCTSGIVPGCKKPTPNDPGDDGFGGNTGSLPPDPFQPIVIEDIYYAGNPEIVKITNLGNKKQSMSGWRLVSHDGTIIPSCPILEDTQTYFFPNNFEIQPQQTALLASYTNAQGFVNENPGSGLFWTERSIWNNNADIGILYNPSGEAVSTYTYGDCANNATAGCVKVKTINFSPSGQPVCTTIANLKADNKCYPNEYMAIRSGVTGFFNVTCPPGQFCKSNKLDFFESIRATNSIKRWTYEDCPSLLGNFTPDGVVDFTFESCDCAPVAARFQIEQAAVISAFSATPPPSRACSTSSSVSFDQPAHPNDYGFVEAEDVFDAMDGNINVSCSKYSPDSDPRNYCYNLVGANASYDLSSWNYSGHNIISTDNKVNLTAKYKVPGFRAINSYTFEDCGIDPVDYILYLDYSSAPCLSQDTEDYDAYGEPLPSACTPYISECLKEGGYDGSSKKYGRAIERVLYEMDFGFEVKIKVNHAKCCELTCQYVPRSDSCPTDNRSIITSEDIAKVKKGETVSKQFFVWRGRVRWIDDSYHYYATVEIKRTNFVQKRPTPAWMIKPKITASEITTEDFNEIPPSFRNSCILDYGFIVPTPEEANPTALENLNESIVNSIEHGYLNILTRRADQLVIPDGQNAGKKLVEISSGNTLLASTINSEVISLIPTFRQKIKDWIGTGMNIRLEFAIQNGIIPGLEQIKTYSQNSLARLTLDMQVSAKPIAKRYPIESCFGCNLNWDFVPSYNIYGDDGQ